MFKYKTADLERRLLWCSKALDFSKTLNPNTYQLLSRPDIIKWMHYDFIKNKSDENAWGIEICSKLGNSFEPQGFKTGKFSQLKVGKINTKIWSSIVGETIVYELYKLIYPNYKLVLQPTFIDVEHNVKYRLDLGLKQSSWAKLIEVKTAMYNSHGTIYEKVPAVPHKYASVPRLAKCGVDIVVVAGQEYKTCMNQYLLQTTPIELLTPEYKQIVDFYKNRQFRYIGASEILHKHITHNNIHEM